MTAKEPKWLTAREMKAWRAYIITSRRLLEALEQDLEDHDLSMPDYEVLAQLSEAPGKRLRMSELADIAMVSKSRLSHRITVMERAGWVRRQACTEDKRGSWAVMTEKGFRAIVKAAPDHVRSVRKRFLDPLSGKDQENMALLCDRIEEGLRKEFKNQA